MSVCLYGGPLPQHGSRQLLEAELHCEQISILNAELKKHVTEMAIHAYAHNKHFSQNSSIN